MRWTQSIAVKSFAVAFVATHIPLLTLVAVVTLRPDWLTPWRVLSAALVATLLATALVIYVLWRMFAPLREAADGLEAFMAKGASLRLAPGSSDEVGRLVRVLTAALAHWDRSRAALLHSGAQVLQRRSAQAQEMGGERLRTVVLLELDQWPALDAEGDLERMEQVQTALLERLAAATVSGEIVLPWGRGRFLLALASLQAEAVGRVQALCQPFGVAGDAQTYHCSAVLETRSGTAVGWASALQRLEQKLYTLRQQGGVMQVA
ncbi:hypothetical protein CHU94_01525 [Rhodoferax sp. TH121]|uniref:hypothetical protein n=1 Tax=Rhodoferax sp. TH121 TaxID=2022803 RepID=UPI000B972AF7|nr:hypothetical protein [Rhodoferax sp. TH121]OYQ42871.1 hypothetical protein CHU94_01525 [Rhodoferax sp. TH121]